MAAAEAVVRLEAEATAVRRHEAFPVACTSRMAAEVDHVVLAVSDNFKLWAVVVINFASQYFAAPKAKNYCIRKYNRSYMCLTVNLYQSWVYDCPKQ